MAWAVLKSTKSSRELSAKTARHINLAVIYLVSLEGLKATTPHLPSMADGGPGAPKLHRIPCMRDSSEWGKRTKRQRGSRLKAYPRRMEMESASRL